MLAFIFKVSVHLSGGRGVSEGGRGGWVKMLSSFLCAQVVVYYNAMILELCVTHLTMCVWVQMMHFGCRTYIPIFEFTPSYLQNSINSDSAILSCRRCTYKRIPALAVEQNNCAVLFYTGRYYLALNTAFLCLYTSASIKNRGYIVQFRHYCRNRPVLRRHQY